MGDSPRIRVVWIEKAKQSKSENAWLSLLVYPPRGAKHSCLR